MNIDLGDHGNPAAKKLWRKVKRAYKNAGQRRMRRVNKQLFRLGMEPRPMKPDQYDVFATIELNRFETMPWMRRKSSS